MTTVRETNTRIAWIFTLRARVTRMPRLSFSFRLTARSCGLSMGFPLTYFAIFFIYLQSAEEALRLHDIARLILILYCLASAFKTIIDTIFI